MEITTVEVSQTNETVATATARQHTILIDRPESVGGTDEGKSTRTFPDVTRGMLHE